LYQIFRLHWIRLHRQLFAHTQNFWVFEPKFHLSRMVCVVWGPDTFAVRSQGSLGVQLRSLCAEVPLEPNGLRGLGAGHRSLSALMARSESSGAVCAQQFPTRPLVLRRFFLRVRLYLWRVLSQTRPIRAVRVLGFSRFCHLAPPSTGFWRPFPKTCLVGSCDGDTCVSARLVSGPGHERGWPQYLLLRVS